MHLNLSILYPLLDYLKANLRYHFISPVNAENIFKDVGMINQ